MIERLEFGRTGHESTRILFGAAALFSGSQERASRVLDTVLSRGVNHIDTAASYGDSELLLAPWLQTNRASVFLATKTGERTADGAHASVERSLERLEVDQLDLIQMHNLTDDAGWQTAMADGGALEGLVRARDEGLVRFIGVTGHGTFAAAMHLRSLERFDFDSVLLPYNYSMMAQPEYAADFEALVELCAQRRVAVQTIKSVARRRWQREEGPRYSWYEPIRDPEAIRRAVHWVLRRKGLFLNTSSDSTLLATTLDAAANSEKEPSDAEMLKDAEALGIEPLFVRGVSDEIR